MGVVVVVRMLKGRRRAWVFGTIKVVASKKSRHRDIREEMQGRTMREREGGGVSTTRSRASKSVAHSTETVTESVVRCLGVVCTGWSTPVANRQPTWSRWHSDFDLYEANSESQRPCYRQLTADIGADQDSS